MPIIHRNIITILWDIFDDSSVKNRYRYWKIDRTVGEVVSDIKEALLRGTFHIQCYKYTALIEQKDAPTSTLKVKNIQDYIIECPGRGADGLSTLPENVHSEVKPYYSETARSCRFSVFLTKG